MERNLRCFPKGMSTLWAGARLSIAAEVHPLLVQNLWRYASLTAKGVHMSGRSIQNAAVLCVLLLGAMTLEVPAKTSHGPPVPALVLRAAAVYTANVRGIIGMQRHFSTVLHAGPVHHTEESDSGLLMKDGSFIKIKYVRIADDG